MLTNCLVMKVDSGKVGAFECICQILINAIFL